MRMLRTWLLILSAFLVGTVNAQERTVSGTVTGEGAAPLSGVTVTNTRTARQSATNESGNYSMVAATGDVLVFTYVGYVRRQVSVPSTGALNVRLESNQRTEEVVTVYGQRASRRAQGSSTQTVSGAEIAETRRENFINSLAGRVAGANITPSSGVPGASTSIVLRGATSLGGNNQALIVVDGVPFDNQTMNQENLAGGSAAGNHGTNLGNRSSDYTNRAADLNPEDIENITVLKGPEATALYGSDGASGAIIITTRKGRSGAPSLSYTNSFRWERVYRFPETQRVYSRGLNGLEDPNATVNPYSAGLLNAYFGPKYESGTQLYDNFNAFFGTGFTQNHSLNLEGGSDATTYRLSTGFIDQTGLVPNTAFTRYNLRIGANTKLSPKVNLATTMAYTHSNNDKAPKGAGSYFLTLLNWPADVDVREYQNPDGSRKLLRGTQYNTTESDNPFWDVNKNSANDKTDRLNANITVNYEPAKWLSFGLISGLDWYTQTGDYTVHPQSRWGQSTNGYYQVYNQVTRNFNNIGRVTFRKNFEKITNSLTLGVTIDDNKTRIESQRGEQFYEANFKSLNNTAPTSRDAKTTVLNIRKTRLWGNYVLGYNNLAFLSLAGSREGNSTLTSRQIDKDPYYNFGSASLSLVLSDIGFLKEVRNLDYAKARLAYGSTGKGPVTPYIIDYTFQSQITTGGGYAYGATGNNFDLRPEYTTNFEYGGELQLFKRRISVDVTRYILSSRDQIIAARSSYGTGYVIKYFNGGVVENKGVEIILKGSPIKRKNFTWDVTANFDRNRGLVKEMPADLPTYYDSDTWVLGNLRSQVYAGSAPGNLAGFGIARNTANQFLISQTSGLPISSGDFGIVGDRQPDFRVGLINNFHYKAFDLSFNLDFRKGGDVFNGNEFILFLTGQSVKTLDREKSVIINGVFRDGLENTTDPTRNTVAVNPYFRSDYFSNSTASEADFIESVNWMRLRDATLRYTLPSSLLKGQKALKTASVFVTGTDLFMITNYSGADPSVNANTAFSRGYGGAGIDYGALATPRGILVGLNVKF